MSGSSPRVLIVTGSLLTGAEERALDTGKKQWAAARASSGAWLDLHLKLGLLGRVGAIRRAAQGPGPGAEIARRLMAEDPLAGLPELTEVALATALRDEGVGFEVSTWSALHADPRAAERLLAATDCVFASSTLLRDASELRPLVRLVKRPHNRVVVGGALVGILEGAWPDVPGVDLLALGWGERLVPAICAWMRSGFTTLTPPPGGSLSRRGDTPLLRVGLPAERSLDALPAPDWSLAEQVHGRRFQAVSYESVRGCPFRCAFCNYPFLFDDSRYRTRSAEAIDRDWARLEAAGVRWISALDSLFTVPRRRVEALCQRLIARGSRVRWLCYARADDLCDPSLVQLMAEAGCVQVQIGAESGSQAQLDRMNKRCTVEQNLGALARCREAGVTSLVTLIVGFPGETAATADATLELLRQGQPDLCFISPFSTKFTALPILEPAARARHGLVTEEGGASSFPAWRHASMDVAEAILRVEQMYAVMAEERLSLDGAAFYQGALGYRPEHRAPLLDLQREAARRGGAARLALRGLMALTWRGVLGQVAVLPGSPADP